MLHIKISGIDQLNAKIESKLKSISTIEYVKITSEERLKDALNSCDIFWFRLNHKLTIDVLTNVRCKYIICAVTGLDHIDLQTCKENGITVISLKGEFEFLKEIRATAEHTWGLLLSLIRKTNSANIHVKKGNWDRTLFQGTELYKKKLGIFGLGRLGEIVASYGKAFGMEIYYFDIQEKNRDSKFIKCDSIESLLSSADILSIHLPYHPNEDPILNDSHFKVMKKGVCIVNTSRGGLIDEIALVKAMEEGIVNGYAADVLFGEPEIHENPIYKYSKENDNVLITPHIGGNTIESIEKTEEFIANKFLNILLEK